MDATEAEAEAEGAVGGQRVKSSNGTHGQSRVTGFLTMTIDFKFTLVGSLELNHTCRKIDIALHEW